MEIAQSIIGVILFVALIVVLIKPQFLSFIKASNAIRRTIAVVAYIIIVGIISFAIKPTEEEAEKKWADNYIEQLRNDSIALNRDWAPEPHQYSYVNLNKKIKEIRELGTPYRFHPEDSTKLFSTSSTESLARHNMAVADSLINYYLPKYRQASAMDLANNVSGDNVRVSLKGDENQAIVIRSVNCLNADWRHSFYVKHKAMFDDMRFVQIFFCAPDGTMIEEKRL